MDGRSDLERISIGRPDIWTKATLTSSIQAPLTNPPAFTVSLVCVLQLGAPRFKFSVWLWENDTFRIFAMELCHKLEAQIRNLRGFPLWSCPGYPTSHSQVMSGIWENPRGWWRWENFSEPIMVMLKTMVSCRFSHWTNQRPTEALSLHSYVMAQLEAIGATSLSFQNLCRRIFFIRLYMVLLSNIFGMNNMNRDYHNDGKSYEHLWARSFA
jgi:hypothetical protein